MRWLGISQAGAEVSCEKPKIRANCSLVWRCIFIGVSLE